MFFFWPIGRDDNRLPRPPYTTIAILAANVVFFFFTFVLEGSVAARAQLAAQRAVEYLLENPYLNLLPELATELDPVDVHALAERLGELRAESSIPPDNALREAQQKLDGLCRRAVSELAGVEQRYERRLGFVPEQATVGSAITSLFIHAGWAHLLGNLFVLFLCAPFVEGAFGGPLFAALYLTGGAAACAMHMHMSELASMPLIGASGAVFAVIGAFLVRFHAARLRFFYCVWIVRLFVGKAAAPAYLILPMLILREVVSAHSAGGGGVAHWAHIGGFAWGFGLALAVGALGIERRFVTPPEGELSIDKPVPVPVDPLQVLERFHGALAGDADAAHEAAEAALVELVRADRCAEAAELLDGVMTFDPSFVASASVQLAIARSVELLGQAPRALALYEGIARDFADDPRVATALARAAELDYQRGEPKAAIESLRRALLLPLDPVTAHEIERRLRVIAIEAGLALPVGIAPAPGAARRGRRATAPR